MLDPSRFGCAKPPAASSRATHPCVKSFSISLASYDWGEQLVDTRFENLSEKLTITTYCESHLKELISVSFSNIVVSMKAPAAVLFLLSVENATLRVSPAVQIKFRPTPQLFQVAPRCDATLADTVLPTVMWRNFKSASLASPCPQTSNISSLLLESAPFCLSVCESSTGSPFLAPSRGIDERAGLLL